MFSYFNIREQSTPTGSLTISELHRLLVTPDRAPFSASIEIIQRLRASTDKAEQDRIKAELPAFTPGAILDTKHKDATPEQKNIRPSGFMQIDIDLQDNINMKDPEAIRAKLAQVPYIALSAISARGQGVWGLIALQEPDKFKQYIDQVHDYFKRARVTLDKSKGKALTELRYFAPDAGAILKDAYLLMPLVPVKPKPRPTAQASTTTATGSTLSELMQWVTDTTGYRLIDHEKHYYIYWLSYAIRKNGYSEIDVYNMIHTNILPADHIHTNCISGGIRHANDKGIYVPTIKQSAPQASAKPYSAKITTPVQLPLKYVPLPVYDVRRDRIGTDGKLTIHYPQLPDLCNN